MAASSRPRFVGTLRGVLLGISLQLGCSSVPVLGMGDVVEDMAGLPRQGIWFQNGGSASLLEYEPGQQLRVLWGYHRSDNPEVLWVAPIRDPVIRIEIDWDRFDVWVRVRAGVIRHYGICRINGRILAEDDELWPLPRRKGEDPNRPPWLPPKD